MPALLVLPLAGERTMVPTVHQQNSGHSCVQIEEAQNTVPAPEESRTIVSNIQRRRKKS